MTGKTITKYGWYVYNDLTKCRLSGMSHSLREEPAQGYGEERCDGEDMPYTLRSHRQ